MGMLLSVKAGNATRLGIKGGEIVLQLAGVGKVQNYGKQGDGGERVPLPLHGYVLSQLRRNAKTAEREAN
jgi:hypothetical protein